jgi:hypothetical protein
MASTIKRTVSGFVVKREYFEEDSTTKTRSKHRVEVSRVFHSMDAAQTLMRLLKKEHPDWELYIHEKNKRDTATLF